MREPTICTTKNSPCPDPTALRCVMQAQARGAGGRGRGGGQRKTSCSSVPREGLSVLSSPQPPTLTLAGWAGPPLREAGPERLLADLHPPLLQEPGEWLRAAVRPGGSPSVAGRAPPPSLSHGNFADVSGNMSLVQYTALLRTLLPIVNVLFCFKFIKAWPNSQMHKREYSQIPTPVLFPEPPRESL